MREGTPEAERSVPREQLLRQTGATGWNPHIFMGMGLASDPQTAAYEPVRAFSRRAGLSDRMGLVIYIGGYLTLATLGTWMLARRFGASELGAALSVLAAVWGGMYLVHFRHPWMFASMAFIPWAAWFADRLVVRR